MEAGDHEVKVSSWDSYVAISDRPSFASLIAAADEAVAAGSDLHMAHKRSCGHPQRLLLPKGKATGMHFCLYVDITSGEDYIDDAPSEGNHGYCGIRGHKYPDKRPMGYPFDRPIPDTRVFTSQKNIHSQIVKITHIGHIGKN